MISKNKVKDDFDSDIIGDVAAPGRERRAPVVAAKRNALRKIWNDISSRWCYHQHVSQTCMCLLERAYVRNSVNRQPKAARLRRGLPLEKKNCLTRRTGGCGLGGRDDPSRNGLPNMDLDELF